MAANKRTRREPACKPASPLDDPSLNQSVIRKLKALGASDEAIEALIKLNPEYYLLGHTGDYISGSVTWAPEPGRPRPSKEEVEAFFRNPPPGGRDAVMRAAREYFGESITRKELLDWRASVGVKGRHGRPVRKKRVARKGR
jgi:hypothetical protein